LGFELQYRLFETLISFSGESIGMKEVWDSLVEHYGEQQVVSFATVEEKQPRVRPMTLIYTDDRFYMITGARGGKDAYKLRQLRDNPRFEYYHTLKGEKVDGFIRGMGESWEVEDEKVKENIYTLIEWSKGFFPTADHPDYVLLELKHDGFSYRFPDTREILRS
jgi:uncharacterized pyridoxamine 5'-phosphate oxidase family protein